MKKLFFLVVFSFLVSAIFFSCNKDDSVSSNGSNPTPTIITQTFSSTPDKTIAPLGWTEDILNVNITDGINAANITNIKLNLNNLEQVSVQNLRFALAHNGTEVFVIDTPLVATAPGNMINTVLFDSATTSITGQTYPFTGTFRPQRPLSSFLSSEASGNWTLRIYNSGSLRSGVIKSWGITISYNKVQPPTTQIWPLAVGIGLNQPSRKGSSGQFKRYTRPPGRTRFP